MRKLLSIISILLLGGMFWACDEESEAGEESPVYILANWAGRDSVLGGRHIPFKMELNAVQGNLKELVQSSFDGYNGRQVLETMQLSGNKKTIEYDFLLPVFPDSVTEMQLRATVINTLGDEWNGTKHFKVFAADYTLTESELSLVEVPAVGKYNGFRFKNGKPERFSTLDANVDETQQHVVIALNENDNKASKGVSSKVPTVRFARVNSFDYANAQYNSVLNTFRSRYNLQDVSASMGNLAVGDIILIGNVDEGKKTATALGVMKVVAVPETNDQEGDVYRFLVKGMGR